MNRQVVALLLAVCCGLCAFAEGQYLETSIELPDTLGPLNGPYCLAWDDNLAHPRLYIGGVPGCESTGVIVADAITCKRLARIPTNTPNALCFVPSHGKLYVAKAGRDSVVVVDCATNLITSTIHTASIVPVMEYNSQNDRLYCGGSSISVIDCAGDSVIHTIAVAPTVLALDSSHNELYAGGSGPLSVIDCTTDSVVAAMPEIGSAGALSFNPTAEKVYASSNDTLYSIRTGDDSIVARLSFSGLAPVMTCDPQRNRIYCAYATHWASIDCVGDTVTRTTGTGVTPGFLASNVTRDRLYVFGDYTDAVTIYDASTGQALRNVMLDGVPSGGSWSPDLNRLYCLPSSATNLLSVVDGTADDVTGILPLKMAAGSISLDTVHNRLYFMYGSSACGCIGVADCSRNVVTSYAYAGEYPAAMCYDPNNDRLYWGTGSSMIVYDCSTNTVAGSLKTSGDAQKARLHLGLNKLYVYAVDTLGSPVIEVIDCNEDSVVRLVALPGELRFLFLVPEDHTLWCLGASHVTVIDCLRDSMVADAIDHLGSIDDACVCREDRKIYTSDGQVIDMDNPAHVESVPFWASRFCYVPSAHKLYGCVNYSGHPPGNSLCRAIDTRTNVLTDSFWLGRQTSGMCLDHTGNYIYCTGYEVNVLLIIDTRADSVLTMFDLPSSTFGPPLLNRTTNRVYPSGSGNPIPVVRDSMLIGLEELKSTQSMSGVAPTLVSRAVPFRSTTPAELYDASGRRIAALRSGLNDISALAPGVYFVRGATGVRETPSVRKVVLTE